MLQIKGFMESNMTPDYLLNLVRMSSQRAHFTQTQAHRPVGVFTIQDLKGLLQNVSQKVQVYLHLEDETAAKDPTTAFSIV